MSVSGDFSAFLTHFATPRSERVCVACANSGINNGLLCSLCATNSQSGSGGGSGFYRPRMPARSSNDLIAMLTPGDRSLSSDIARIAAVASVAAPAVSRLATNSSTEKINDQRMVSPDAPPPTSLFGRESFSQPTLLAPDPLEFDYYQANNNDNLNEVDMKSLTLDDHAPQPPVFSYGGQAPPPRLSTATTAVAAPHPDSAAVDESASNTTKVERSDPVPAIDLSALPSIPDNNSSTNTASSSSSSWTRAMPKPRSKSKINTDVVPPVPIAAMVAATTSPPAAVTHVSPRGTHVSPRGPVRVSPRTAAQVSPRGGGASEATSPRTTSASPRGSDALSPRSSGGDVPSEADVGSDGKPRCYMCGTDSTPQWRRTLDGKGHAPLLCNSCGLKERRAKKRLEEAMREGRVRDDGTIERRAATRDDDKASGAGAGAGGSSGSAQPARHKIRSRTGPIVNQAGVASPPSAAASASSSAATSPRGHEFSYSNPAYSGMHESTLVNQRSTSGRRAAAAAAVAIAATVPPAQSSPPSAPAVPPPPPPFVLPGYGMTSDGSFEPPPPLEPALLLPRGGSTGGAMPGGMMRQLARSQGAVAAVKVEETPMSPAITSPKRRRRLDDDAAAAVAASSPHEIKR